MCFHRVYMEGHMCAYHVEMAAQNTSRAMEVQNTMVWTNYESQLLFDVTLEHKVAKTAKYPYTKHKILMQALTSKLLAFRSKYR